MDLTKLSTEDLQALQSGDLSRVSTQGLQMLQGAASNQPQRTQNNDLASAAGLTLRAGVKSMAALPAMLADAAGGVANFAQDKILGEGKGYRFPQQLPQLDALLTRIGLPNPDTPMQRIAGKGLELGLGAGAAAKAADLTARGATGATQAVLQRLAADPATQVAAGGAAGAAGQQSAESGGGDGAQFVSALLGGLGGAGAVGGVRAATNALAQRNAPTLQPVEIERRITAALQRQGIDPASITPAMMAALRKDAEQALRLPGSLNEQALARLADYRRLGLTPTRGRVTLDPFDVTQEQNAMRMAAATGARDARLPQIAQGNNAGLLNMVEQLGPMRDNAAAGDALLRSVRGQNATMGANVDQLYQAARDSAGRPVVLNGPAAAQNAVQQLQQSLAPRLAPEVDAFLNDLTTGRTQLTVDYQQQLLRDLGRKLAAAQRSQDGGDTAHALGIVRRAIENADVLPSPQVNPRNLPAIPGTAPPSNMKAGQEAIDAFTRARGAARERFAWQESAPGITRALDDATNADTFVRNNIISPTASLRDVSTLAQSLDAPAREAARGAIVQYLRKSAGIGETQTSNFSGKGWNKALDEIGDRKLALFFNREEVAQLRAMGRVGEVEVWQPRGSAVNNSNTAAGIAGLLQGLSKNLGPLINKIPGGQALVSPAMDNLTLSYTERGLTNVPRGLMTAPQAPRGGLLDPLLLPALTGGGLLSASP